MNGLTIMVGAMVIFFLGYRFYGRWLEKTWGIDPAALTPAQRFNDGNDFSPQNRWSVFAHQFTSITGAGPVTGPIIAAMFGWLPALLWMIVGGIFFGAVQDFTALYASVKNNGRSIGMLIEDYIGALGRRLFLLFCWLFTLLVIAAFCDMVANTFNGFTKDGAEILPNAAAGSISLIYMAGAILFGLYLKYMRPSAGIQLAVGIVLMVIMVWLGIANPIYLDGVTWRYVIFAYLFAAAVMPMWLLKNPRDYLSMFLLIGMIAAGVIGVIVINPSIELPAFVGFEVKNQPLFPILFVTIACGAVSGFHSLVSSGTSSKMISSEKDMRLVGYGSMCVEVVLGARFPGINKTLKDFDFKRHYGAEVKEIKRNGAQITRSIERVPLAEGDTLVVMADDSFVATWGESSFFLMIANGKDTPSRSNKKKRVLTLVLLVLMIVGATIGELPVTREAFPNIQMDMFFFAAVTTIVMAWCNIFPARKYTKFISWDILITIACAFAISKAMTNSGMADLIADYIIGLSHNHRIDNEQRGGGVGVSVGALYSEPIGHRSYSILYRHLYRCLGWLYHANRLSDELDCARYW